jgi:beta-lactamase class A
MLSDAQLGALGAAAGLGEAHLHVRRLPDGPVRHSDDGRWIYPASMIKLPLAVAAGAAIAAGRLEWASPATVDPTNLTANDVASPMVAGYRTTIRELVTWMLQRSDNVATNVLYDVLDRERATTDLHALGFTDTFLRRKLSGSEPLIDDPAATGRNSFSAAQAADLLAALASDRLPESHALRAILATSWWDVKLSRGLEPGDAFAHKTGDTDEVSHDGGILRLDGGGTWIVVAYTDRPSSDEQDACFGAFMRALRPHLVAADTASAAVPISEGALGAGTKGASNPSRDGVNP